MRIPILLSVLTLCLALLADESTKPKMTILQTPSGVRFGILGDKPAAPAPTLFVFAGTLETSLGDDNYIKMGLLVAKEGFLCVSLDAPCHGADQKPGEPSGLEGWRARLEKGDDFLAAFNAKASKVLDYLIQERYTDPQKIAAAGTSRGGFLALHFAASDPRVKYVAAFAPVINLLALREFHGLEKHQLTQALTLTNFADKLAGRAFWVCIGNNDQRVGTDYTIAFTRKLTEVAVARDKPANIELHVMPTVGHSIHPTAHDEAAAWLLRQISQAK